MNMRLADANETEKIKSLWQDCFNDPQIYADWVFQNLYKPENTVIAEENGRVVSAAQMLPYFLTARGKKVPVCYIIGVCTAPEYRGKGYAAAMMNKIRDIACERGYALVMLYPSISGYYERFGFVPVSSFAEVKISGKGLPASGLIADAAEDDIPRLNRIYERYMHGMSLYVHRDNRHWKAIMDDFVLAGGGIKFVRRGETVCGYFVYTLKAGELKVAEAAFTSPEGLREILNALYSFNADTINIRLPHRDIKLLEDGLAGEFADVASAGADRMKINTRLGAMLQTADREKAEEIYHGIFGHSEKNLDRFDHAGFTEFFFGSLAEDDRAFINLAGWN